MTIFFRNLSAFSSELPNSSAVISEAFYETEIAPEVREKWNVWFQAYQNRLIKEPLSDVERAKQMNAVNPKYVLRNYMAQLAIEAAEKEDYTIIDTFYQLLKKPYDEQPNHQKWFTKRPDWAKDKVGCSMLSCSS